MTIAITAKTALARGTRPNCPQGVQTPALTGAIRICALGDSRTYGQGYGSAEAFRKDVHTLLGASPNLSAAGVTWTWVGTTTAGTAPSNSNRGVPGSTCADHISGGTYDTVTFVPGTLDPHVWIVNLGTNDCADAGLTTNFQANLEALVNALDAAGTTDTRFVVCKPPTGGDATRRGRFPSIWTAMDAAVTALISGGKKVTVADLRVTSPRADYMRSETAGTRLHEADHAYLKEADMIYVPLVNAIGQPADWPA